MRDLRLAALNFTEVLDYGGQPRVQNSYSSPLECRGYCISCETNGLLRKSGGRLDLISHGCDSSDFEAVLGPMPRQGVPIEQPVLFLLENPGGEKENGTPVHFQGCTKQPPVNHYYWTPNVQTWPSAVADFNCNFYGPYFAYLMRRHQLLNVYITNLVKCKWVADGPSGDGDTSIILKHCVDRYLTKEFEIFLPQVALCFGKRAEVGLRALLHKTGRTCRAAWLMHPAFIQFRSQTVGRSQEDLIRENDDRICQVLGQLV